MKNPFLSFLGKYFVIFFPIVILFSSSLFVPSDSDIGWHLKYGEYFSQNLSILRKNIYSTMMPGFEWVNSSWATDLLSYGIFRHFDFIGLSIFGAGIITVTILLFSSAAKLTFWEKAIIFPLLIYIERPLFEVSFRGQLLSLMFTGILFYLFSNYADGRKKSLLLTIPLFTIWSNFHGQFLLGIGLLVLWSFIFLIRQPIRSLVNKQKLRIPPDTLLLLIIIFSIIATTVNPFGISALTESLKHFGNPLQKYIVEWTPFDRYSLLWWNLVFWDMLILSGIYILYRRKQVLEYIHLIIPIIILLFISYYVRRYAWSMYLISLPLVRITISYFEPKTKKISTAIASLLLIIVYMYTIFIKAPKENVLNMNWDRFCYQYVGCSPESANFLVERKFTGKLMTFYNWGGWLIYNYPQLKPSIDGRMHLWEDQNGYSAFKEYYPYEQNWKDIDLSGYDIVYMTPNKPVFQRLVQLVTEGKWKVEYQDLYASVFSRIK